MTAIIIPRIDARAPIITESRVIAEELFLIPIILGIESSKNHPKIKTIPILIISLYLINEVLVLIYNI